MTLSNPRGLQLRTGLAALAVVTSLSVFTATRALATEGMHFDGSGREEAFLKCTTCHGSELRGSVIAPSCMSCHSEFLPEGMPATGHHVDGRDDPLTNCAECHGSQLRGGSGPSCFACHDQLWPGPPIADGGGPYTGSVGLGLTFDGSGSSDPVGTIVSYAWDFGDGDTATEVSPAHTYASEGLYTVTLTVTDNDGLTDTATTLADITVSDNLPPVADPGGPYTGGVGVAVSFDGSSSFDSDGTIVLYSWDFGDGNWGVGETLEHTYAATGLYTVTLSVRDDGGLAGTATVPIVISESSNSPPNVDAGGPYTGAPGEDVQFDASGSSDPDGDPLVAFWTFEGDTFPSSGLTTTHAWSDPGTYTATVSVTDGVSVPVSVEVQVVISDSSPPDNPGDGGDLTGGAWLVTAPFGFEDFLLTFRSFYGNMLLAEMTCSDGYTSMGIGLASGNVVYWMDGNGSIFIGDIDPATDTMSGIMLSGYGGTPWFAERWVGPLALPDLGL